MKQVLFEIPVIGVPIFGYGVMLVVAYFLCTWLAGWMAEKHGGSREAIYDLSFWVFVAGLVGGRLFFVTQYHNHFDRWFQFFVIWKGGLVVYGAALGGLAALLLFAWQRRIRALWLLDIVSPALALGMGIGRLGCLLNGCCYGDYCEHSWALRFPPASPVYGRMVERDHQSGLGFIVLPEDRRVLVVEPGSDAERQGLRVGDRIVAIDDVPVDNARALARAVEAAGVLDAQERARFLAEVRLEPRQAIYQTLPVRLTIQRDGKEETLLIQRPRSLPVQPTQIYSSISGFVIFAALLALFPFRRRDGQIIALFAMMYAVGRFLVEYLRFDESPILFGWTISQNISVLMFAAGLATLLFVGRRPVQYGRGEMRTAAFPASAGPPATDARDSTLPAPADARTS